MSERLSVLRGMLCDLLQGCIGNRPARFGGAVCEMRARVV